MPSVLRALTGLSWKGARGRTPTPGAALHDAGAAPPPLKPPPSAADVGPAQSPEVSGPRSERVGSGATFTAGRMAHFKGPAAQGPPGQSRGHVGSNLTPVDGIRLEPPCTPPLVEHAASRGTATLPPAAPPPPPPPQSSQPASVSITGNGPIVRRSSLEYNDNDLDTQLRTALNEVMSLSIQVICSTAPRLRVPCRAQAALLSIRSALSVLPDLHTLCGCSCFSQPLSCPVAS